MKNIKKKIFFSFSIEIPQDKSCTTLYAQKNMNSIDFWTKKKLLRKKEKENEEEGG